MADVRPPATEQIGQIRRTDVTISIEIGGAIAGRRNENARSIHTRIARRCIAVIAITVCNALAAGLRRFVARLAGLAGVAARPTTKQQITIFDAVAELTIIRAIAVIGVGRN